MNSWTYATGTAAGAYQFLLGGVVITWYVTQTTISPAYRKEITNYLFSITNADGGWGLHTAGESTVLGTAFNYAVLRIDASVKGVWPLHCHIAWHLAEGFMGAVVIHPDAIQSNDLWTSEAQELCNSGLEDGACTSDTEPGRRRRRSIQNMLKVAHP